jgi:AcrR family transcriptional regulator
MQINPNLQPELGLSVTEAARRSQIVAATIELIAELGYAKTTFARIVERAGLSSTRMISYHFGTKNELMRVVLSTVIHTKDLFLGERAGATTDRGALVRAYIEAEVAFLGAYPVHVRALLELTGAASEATSDPMFVPLLQDLRFGRLERQLRQGQREGVFGEFAADVMAMAIAQAVDGVAARLGTDPELDLERYGRELAGLFERATRAGARD